MRQRFVSGVGGTLVFAPPEVDAGGAPTSGTITIKRASSGGDLPAPVVDAAIVIDGDDLTFVLTGANCPDPVSTSGAVSTLAGSRFVRQPLFRAVWTYLVDGKTYQADMLYEVRRRVLRPTLTVDELVRRLPASLEELTGDATSGTAIDMIGDTWDDLLDDLSSKGYEPDKIMDADRLRSVHRALAIATFAKTWGPAWREYAKEREQDYRQDLADALTSHDWYDKDQSLTQAPGEVRTLRIDCSR